MTVPAAAALLLLLAAVVLCSYSSAACDDEVQRPAVPAMYVFGDSLVDAGNNDFLPPPVPLAPPPNGVDLPSWVSHRTGRFTNGFNLADIIAQHVGFKLSPPAYLSLSPLSNGDLLKGHVGANYASGGSGILDITVTALLNDSTQFFPRLYKTRLSNNLLPCVQGNGTTILTLREQVQLFAETKDRITRAGMVGGEGLDDLLAQSLFVISTGGNDFDAFDYGLPMSEAPTLVAAMVDTYIEHINELYRLGARKLALLDILPVGCIPSQRAITANGDCDADGNTASRMFNAVLRKEMAIAVEASMPGLRYSIASLYNVLSDMIAHPALAGLREVEVACCGGGKFNGEVNCAVANSLCADRDEYLFWDVVHGTEAAYHRAVHAFFHGTERHAEPINFAQLVGASSMAQTMAYSNI